MELSYSFYTSDCLLAMIFPDLLVIPGIGPLAVGKAAHLLARFGDDVLSYRRYGKSQKSRTHGKTLFVNPTAVPWIGFIMLLLIFESLR